MCKILSRIAFVLLVVGMGYFPAVFAIDFEQALNQASDQALSLGDIFKGKSSVSDVYSKSLKLAKDNQIKNVAKSLDQLSVFYQDCPKVKKQDIINVLYNSQSSFAQQFDVLVRSSAISLPDAQDIQSSYDTFFACKKILAPTATDRTTLEQEIFALYSDRYTNSYTLSTLNQDNFGADFFWNGALDDSDFDILYDIQKIGKILFEEMKDVPQILFYRLPQIRQVTTMGGGDLSSLYDQSYEQGGSSTFGGPSSSTTTSTTSSSSPTTSSSSSQTSLDVLDVDSQTFVQETNGILPTTFSPADPLVFGNQCLASSAPQTSSDEPTSLTQSQEAYLSGLESFFSSANINDIINSSLFSQTHSGQTISGSSLANTYAEEVFNDPASPGTCEYACKDLPMGEQMQCELDCAKSCIEQCDGLPAQDKVLCVADCTCFMISGPNGPGWENMEDMYRIKFCTVPVQQKSPQRRTRVYSIQAIFQEISDVLEGLRDSGQIIKFSKTKEYLDGQIKVKFADMFAFKAQVGFKPLFERKSTQTKINEHIQQNNSLQTVVLGASSTIEADNPNKYVIISDVAKNKSILEYADFVQQLDENFAKFVDGINQSTQQASLDVVKNLPIVYSREQSILFVKNMVSFLEDNQNFWSNFGAALLDMNTASMELKAKIEKSQ